MRALLLLMVVGPWLAAGQPAPKASQAQTYVVGVSPFLNTAVKDDVYRSLVHLLVQDLPLNSTVFFYDAFNLETIAHVALPDARAFESPKTRANQFAPCIRQLKQFLAADHPRPVDAKLKF